MKRPHVPAARRLRKNSTDAENLMWRHLRNRRLLGYKFRRQFPVGPFIVDFACPEENTIVELDGGQHAARDTEDAWRTTFLEACGYRVVRFWNNDVLNNPEAVLQVIADVLCPSRLPLTPALSPKGRGGSKRGQGFPLPLGRGSLFSSLSPWGEG